MNRSSLFKLLLIIFSAFVIASCSSMKNKGANAPVSGADDSSYAQGVGGGDTFGDSGMTSGGQKICAPCKQSYYFDFDNDAVHQEDVVSIQKQAAYLVAHPSAKIRLEGNTDERGSREYNVALGWRRAKAVCQSLQRQGVSSRQISTISYGEEKPVAFGHDEESWHNNRRVDLIYEAK